MPLYLDLEDPSQYLHCGGNLVKYYVHELFDLTMAVAVEFCEQCNEHRVSWNLQNPAGVLESVLCQNRGKGKGHPITVQEGPEGE